MTRSVRMAALGVFAALALGACGDAEGIGGAQRENAQRADAICEQTQDRVGKLADDPGADRDAVRAAAEQLNALDAPSENETTWLQFVRDTENLWIALEDVAQARLPEVNEQARANTAVARVRDTNNRLIELATKYGMEECGEIGFGTNP